MGPTDSVKLKAYRPYMIILLAALSMLSCSGVSPNAEVPTLQAGGTFLDVPYGEHYQQNMDVFLPAATTTAAPVIVYLHGGGWHYGDKDEITAYASSFQQGGYAFFSINYRLGNVSYHLDDKLDNVQQALAFIQTHRADLNLSDKLTLWGSSAGGHMALVYAFTVGRHEVDAVISHAGPTDLSSAEYKHNDLSYVLPQLSGARGAKYAQWLAENSPVNLVTGDAPPILLVHGNKDSTVIYQNSLDLHTIYQQQGLNSTLITLDEVDHMGLGEYRWDVNQPSLPEWAAWIEQHSR